MSDPSRAGPFEVGDRVRVDIPDETRSDHIHHGKHGEVIAVIPASERSSTDADGTDDRYRIALDTGSAVDVKPHDLRPPI